MAVALTLEAPGLTVDEPINLGHGKAMATVLFTNPLSISRPDVIDRIWRSGHEHPPLTRFLVGVGQWLVDPDPKNPQVLTPRGGRLASAAAYGLILYLCVDAAAASAGCFAGLCAGIAAATLPRLFGQAHFASPEVVSAALILAAVVSAGRAFSPPPQHGRGRPSIASAGIVLGLALLTKLTAVIIPLSVLIAIVPTIERRTALGWLRWGTVGVCVFFVGWPWLWPIDLPGYPPGWTGALARLREFLATGSDRAALYTWYLGKQYAGPKTPWHFVWLYFFITVPVATHAFGLLGWVRCLRLGAADFSARLFAVAPVVALLIFTLPLHRYDGERLFLFVFPLWAVVAGIGAASAAAVLGRLGKTVFVRSIIVALLAAQVYAVAVFHPFQLSYFNFLVGGLAGADRLGLEATYWGDSLTDEVLRRFSAQAGRGENAVLLPTLYAGHALHLQSPAMQAKRQAIVPGDWLFPPGAAVPEDRELLGEARWAVIYNRRGYLLDPLPMQVLRESETIFELVRDGVWLARVVRLPDGWRLARPTR